ncbi:MAG: sodium:proton antiporter [Comamonadaceae bacterium CG_4_9_14_3_um_filter_60_33]|nr:MAG: sodium:proton antiporter [Comamonadaceae bacterium CG_4_10_14_3_um_filter_60_42]PJB44653.1 MAG: sodium:proton antiporter [Comamonadaceae bacterium CG_4_9_14_3_um_filter_60_33]
MKVQRVFKRFVVGSAALAFSVLLIGVMLEPPAAGVDLRAAVSANLAVSGVAHPVTAVLLNFRGYDTLLEIAVLLLALIVILASGLEALSSRPRAVDPVLQTLAQLAAPSMIVVAVYLLWAGAFRPGGAFQAGAVLAAAGVLLHLTGLLPGWQAPTLKLRLGLTAGLLIFLAIAAAVLSQGALMQYPPRQAGMLILLIEAGFTVSLGLILAGLFLFISRDPGDPT